LTEVAEMTEMTEEENAEEERLYTGYNEDTDTLQYICNPNAKRNDFHIILDIDPVWYFERHMKFPMRIPPSEELQSRFDLLGFNYVISKIMRRKMEYEADEEQKSVAEKIWISMTRSLPYIKFMASRMVGYHRLDVEEEENFMLYTMPRGFFFQYLAGLERDPHLLEEMPRVSFILQCMEYYTGDYGVVIQYAMMNPEYPPATEADIDTLREYITNLKNTLQDIDPFYELAVLDDTPKIPGNRRDTWIHVEKCPRKLHKHNLSNEDAVEHDSCVDSFLSGFDVMTSTTHAYTHDEKFDSIVASARDAMDTESGNSRVINGNVVSTDLVHVDVEVMCFPFDNLPGLQEYPDPLLYVHIERFINHYGIECLRPYFVQRRAVQKYVLSLGVDTFDPNIHQYLVIRQGIPFPKQGIFASVTQKIYLRDPEPVSSEKIDFGDVQVDDAAAMKALFRRPSDVLLKHIITKLMASYIAITHSVPRVTCTTSNDIVYASQKVISNRNAQKLLEELELEEEHQTKKKEKRSKKKKQKKSKQKKSKESKQTKKCLEHKKNPRTQYVDTWDMWKSPWYIPVHRVISDIQCNPLR
jgi:hypothetical protein